MRTARGQPRAWLTEKIGITPRRVTAWEQVAVPIDARGVFVRF